MEYDSMKIVKVCTYLKGGIANERTRGKASFNYL